MRWYSFYKDNILFEQWLLRNPQVLVNLETNVSFLFSNLSELRTDLVLDRKREVELVNFMSGLSVLSGDSEISLRRNGGGAKRLYKFRTNMSNFSTDNFLDFFFTVLLPVLRKRYMDPKRSNSSSGMFQFCFSNLSELGLDDFFFLICKIGKIQLYFAIARVLLVRTKYSYQQVWFFLIYYLVIKLA